MCNLHITCYVVVEIIYRSFNLHIDSDMTLLMPVEKSTGLWNIPHISIKQEMKLHHWYNQWFLWKNDWKNVSGSNSSVIMVVALPCCNLRGTQTKSVKSTGVMWDAALLKLDILQAASLTKTVFHLFWGYCFKDIKADCYVWSHILSWLTKS